MLVLRPAAERGHSDFGWLDSRHSFSFGDFHDPQWLGFRGLRVINDDRIAAGGGFPTHPHRDMEIISWIAEGALAHRDSTGTASLIQPGDAQRMTAGSGIRHSEFNHHPGTTRLLQIWLMPIRKNLPPSYEQRAFPVADRRGRLTLIASRDGRQGSIVLNADADLHIGTFASGDGGDLALAPGRHGWVQVVTGAVIVNGQALTEGDGLGLSEESSVRITATAESEVQVFDLG